MRANTRASSSEARNDRGLASRTKSGEGVPASEQGVSPVTARRPDGRFVASQSGEERFWGLVDFEHPSGCWRWTGKLSGKNYGLFKVGGRWVRAHRYAHGLRHGPIAAGNHIDHSCHDADLDCPGGVTCEHRPCVLHTEELTPGEHMRRTRARTAERKRRQRDD